MTSINDTEFASISELKRDARGLVEKMGHVPIIILNHNTPEMVLMSIHCYRELCDKVKQISSIQPN